MMKRLSAATVVMLVLAFVFANGFEKISLDTFCICSSILVGTLLITFTIPEGRK